MAQPVVKLPKPLPLSGHARLNFAFERFGNIDKELPPLFRRHWEEIAHDRETIPLDPDWASYYDLDARGRLHILAARNAFGQLVGYVFNLVGGHLHYVSTTYAHTEMFWLAPMYRQGWEPVRMFLVNMAGLKERGAVVSTIGFKLEFQQGRVGKLLARLGYRPVDIVCKKVL